MSAHPFAESTRAAIAAEMCELAAELREAARVHDGTARASLDRIVADGYLRGTAKRGALRLEVLAGRLKQIEQLDKVG